MAQRILLVDDEPQIADVLRAYLERDSFDPVVEGTVAGALAQIERRRPDLMILDITLPDGSGLDVLRQARAAGHIPTIMLTARTDEVDRVLGLELGADDYVTKPFSPREVLARVRAVLRRVTEPRSNQDGAATGSKLQVRELSLDEQRHDVRIGSQTVSVTPAEFRILRAFMQNADLVLSRAQLLDMLGDDGSVYERTLDRHINNLRHKIERDPRNPDYIMTVFGVGYRMPA
jgi:DNA-binding response OmpR family regulator